MNYKDFTLITADSRKVIPGALFVAVKGYASDGHNYIQSAIDKGAKGIICEYIPEGLHTPESVATLGRVRGRGPPRLAGRRTNWFVRRHDGQWEGSRSDDSENVCLHRPLKK